MVNEWTNEWRINDLPPSSQPLRYNCLNPYTTLTVCLLPNSGFSQFQHIISHQSLLLTVLRTLEETVLHITKNYNFAWPWFFFFDITTTLLLKQNSLLKIYNFDIKRNFSLSPLEQPIKNSFSSAPRWKQIKECEFKTQSM